MNDTTLGVDQRNPHASVIIEAGCLSFRKEPVVFSSGIKSPVYCDTPLLMSQPPRWRNVVHSLARLAERSKPFAYLGVATAGIPLATILAFVSLTQRPTAFGYVRSKPKEWGKQNLIEGFPEGALTSQRVVVVDNVATTGKSLLTAIRALREVRAVIEKAYVLVDYALAPTHADLEKEGVALHSLVTVPVIVREMFDRGLISEEELNIFRDWHQDPINYKF